MGNVVDIKETKAAISDNLRKLLAERGWTQGDLCRKIFEKVDTPERMIVSRWFTGKTAPSAADLLNLAEAFGVTAEDIARKKKSRKSA
jgi:transcriptional regulator with XRE-family HTH domain